MRPSLKLLVTAKTAKNETESKGCFAAGSVEMFLKVFFKKH